MALQDTKHPSHASRSSIRSAATNESRLNGRTHPVLVGALIVLFALEYVRPPALQSLHLPMLLVLMFCTLWAFSRERPWSRNLTLQACFIGTGALMVPFARNNYEVYHSTRVLFTYFATALAVTWLLAYRREFRRAVWAWVAVMCFQALWAIFHEGRGHGGFFGDENDLALACVMAFPLSMCGFEYLRGWGRWTCGLSAIVLLMAIVVSFSRGGFVGLLVASCYMLLLGRNRLRRLAIAGFAAMLFVVLTPSEYKREIETIRETSSGTAETRLFLWTAAVRMWMDHPLFGVGPYNSAYRVGEYQPQPTKGGLFTDFHFTDRDWSGKTLHSLYFELLADRGLVGCVIYGLILVGHFRILRGLRATARSIERSRPALAREATMFALALEAAVAGFLAAGAFLSMVTYPYLWTFTAFAVALDRAVRREIPSPDSTSELQNRNHPRSGRAAAHRADEPIAW